MDKKELIKFAYLDFHSGNWNQAIEKYKQLKKMDGQDSNVLCLLGDLYAKNGQISNALQQYKQVVAIYRQQNLSAKVDSVYNKMSKLDPDSAENDELEYDASKGAVAKTKDTPEIVTLKQAVASDAKNAEHLSQLADLLKKQGNFQEAAAQYLVLGNVLYSSKQFDKAAEVFKKIVGFAPQLIQGHIALAETFVKEGSDSDAKKEYLYAAELLIRKGDLERGQLFAQKAIQLKSIEAHYYMGLIYYQNKNIEEAKKEFETLLKFKINHQGGVTHLAKIFIELNQFDEATKHLEKLLKIDPKNAEGMEILADLAMQQNQTALALEKYTSAMDTFAEEEQWERTAICADKAVKLDAENKELYLKLADACYNAGLEDLAAEACTSLATVLEAQGKKSEAEQMRAKAREITGEESAPIEKPLEPVDVPLKASSPAGSVATTPTPAATVSGKDNIQMLLNIADTYIQQGSLDEAIEIYQKILKTDSENEIVKSALTRVYAMFAGINPETAVARKSAHASKVASEQEEQRTQREARENAQREAQLRTQRKASADVTVTKASDKEADLLQSIGSTKEDEIAGDNQDEFMTVTVAEIYTKQGLLNEALKIYQKILEIEPGNQEARLKKQELENRMVEQEKLRQQSEKAATGQAEAERKATKEKAATEKAEAKRKAAEEKTGVEPKKADAKNNKKKDDDQEPPRRRSRVSYV